MVPSESERFLRKHPFVRLKTLRDTSDVAEQYAYARQALKDMDEAAGRLELAETVGDAEKALSDVRIDALEVMNRMDFGIEILLDLKAKVTKHLRRAKKHAPH